MPSQEQINAMEAKNQLRDGVATRLARVNPGMSNEEALAKAEQAINDLRTILSLPRYCEVINMTHQQLILVLQCCPESPYFATDGWEFDEARARHLVLGFVERANFGNFNPLHEATPSVEESKGSGSNGLKSFSTKKCETRSS